MKYFIVKQNDNYADEFNVEGFFITKGDSKEEVLNSLKPDEETEFPAERYFGTNEYMQWETKEDYLNTFDVKEITEQEYKTIKKVVGESYGHVLTLD